MHSVSMCRGSRGRALKLHANKPFMVPTFLVFTGILCRGMGLNFVTNSAVNNKGSHTRRIGLFGTGPLRGAIVQRRPQSVQPSRSRVRLPFNFKAMDKDDVDDDDWDFEGPEEFVLHARMAPTDCIPDWARRCVVRGEGGQESFLVTRSYKVQEIPETLHDRCYSLLKANMYDMYEESSWGWNEAFKRREHANPYGRFITVTKGAEPGFGPAAGAHQPPTLLAYVNYRYELLDNTFTNTSSGVLYVHELQVAEEARRQGLGKHLMALMQEFAESARMEKLMLCVFRYNGAAVSFYRESMGFELDTSSRFNSAQNDVFELCKYVGAHANPESVTDAPRT